jgi:hypothetical protein
MQMRRSHTARVLGLDVSRMHGGNVDVFGYRGAAP